MQTIQKVPTERVIFFDNIRYLMVLLVVVLHSACGYSYYTTWWSVNDENSIFFNYVLGILGVFLMPTLFFIAGYFALPSLLQKGRWLFIRSKLKRLGIPWLLGVVLVSPIINYIHLYSRDYPANLLSLWSIFVNNIKGALSFHTGFITSQLQFSHDHFWFISLLFFFFIAFAILHDGKNRWFPGANSSTKQIVARMKSILVVVFLVSVLTAVTTFFIYGIFHGTPNRDPWITIGSIIQFQASKIVLYIACFSLGIYAFSKNWFKDGQTPGHLVFWTILSTVLMYSHFKVQTFLMADFSIGLALGWVLIRTFLVFTILLALIGFGIKFWNSPSKVNRRFAANSYNIYLLHMLFVIVVQLVLLKWFGISIFFKFGIVALFSILLSYLVSQYAVRPFPKLSVAGIIALFVLLAAVLNPAAG